MYVRCDWLAVFTLASFTLENKALFLGLGPPSTLICRENGAFRNTSSNWRNLKAPALRYNVDGKQFLNGALRKRWHNENRVISLPEVYSNHRRTTLCVRVHEENL